MFIWEDQEPARKGPRFAQPERRANVTAGMERRSLEQSIAVMGVNVEISLNSILIFLFV